MGMLHEAWKGTPSTVTTFRNARGQVMPTGNGSMDAAYEASEAERLARLAAERKALAASKRMALALAIAVFGDGVELTGLLATWPLEGKLDGWRVVRGRETVGFIAEFAGHMETWTVDGFKPGQKIG